MDFNIDEFNAFLESTNSSGALDWSNKVETTFNDYKGQIADLTEKLITAQSEVESAKAEIKAVQAEAWRNRKAVQNDDAGAKEDNIKTPDSIIAEIPIENYSI